MSAEKETRHRTGELRRGIVTLAVLACLRTENHGYAIPSMLESKGLPLKEGTLYPLLRRLEGQQLLISRWDVSGDRLRRYYTLTQLGSGALELLQSQWELLSEIVVALQAQHE